MSRIEQRKSWKRAAAFCLAGVLAVSLAGCGGKSGDGKDGTGGKDAGTGEAPDGGTAMGRYVETMVDVDTGQIMDLRELSDGRLALLEDGAEGRWISEDNGETWKPDELPGWYDFVMGNYVYDMKAAPDGSVAVLYESYGSLRGETDEEDSPGKDNAGRNSGIWLIPAQGESKQIAVPTSEEEMVSCLCFSEDGSRLFVGSIDQKIYEIDREAGTAKLFLTADIMPDVLCVWENYMAIKNEREGVALYHLDAAEQIEDDVITDFVNKNCAVNNQIAESTYSIFPAEEEGIYLVCGKGVYRHVIGGTVMEQVINGGLCSLSDPMKHVAKMIRTAEEGFMAAFSEGKISSFSYDPNISTVPSQNLTAYSLTENDILRQAIIRYQGEHPDVYVKYKVGMDEEGAATREDAVKKLNTEIMAGKGPDFLLLDGLPADSYVEKGANCQTALTPGSVKDAFRPYALMGINAASDKVELSGGLLREILAKDMQSMIYPTGFPVNEEGLQTYIQTLGGQLPDGVKPGEPYGGYGLTDDSGVTIYMGIYMPTEQEMKELYDLLSSVRTPYLSDTVVEDAVRKAGKWYLEDKCSLEAAVELVQEKIAIYMAE